MNIPGSEHREINLHEALQRDALRARELPPFDPALHASVMRRVRHLSNARNARFTNIIRLLVERWSMPITATAVILIVGLGMLLRQTPQNPSAVKISSGPKEPSPSAQSFHAHAQTPPVLSSDSLRNLSLLLSGLPDKNFPTDFLVISSDGVGSDRPNLEISEVAVRLDCGHVPSKIDRLGVLLDRPGVGASRPF